MYIYFISKMHFNTFENTLANNQHTLCNPEKIVSTNICISNPNAGKILNVFTHGPKQF